MTSGSGRIIVSLQGVFNALYSDQSGFRSIRTVLSGPFRVSGLAGVDCIHKNKRILTSGSPNTSMTDAASRRCRSDIASGSPCCPPVPAAGASPSPSLRAALGLASCGKYNNKLVYDEKLTERTLPRDYNISLPCGSTKAG